MQGLINQVNDTLKADVGNGRGIKGLKVNMGVGVALDTAYRLFLEQGTVRVDLEPRYHRCGCLTGRSLADRRRPWMRSRNKAALFVDLVAFVFISFKFQILQGLSRIWWRCLSSRR